MAAGETLAKVGYDLEPCTSTVNHFVLRRDEYDVVFVDTPGFNHPSKTDCVILKEIIDWLKSESVFISILTLYSKFSSDTLEICSLAVLFICMISPGPGIFQGGKM